ncbi:MAG: PAM68 family protein [Cyanobacteria bacterium J06648_16]
MPSESERTSLPFEPKSRSKTKDRTSERTTGAPAGKAARRSTARSRPAKADKAGGAQKSSSRANADGKKTADVKRTRVDEVKSGSVTEVVPPDAIPPDAIPEAVSRRMVKRMLVFSGIPTAMAGLIFVGSYIVLLRGMWEVPTSLVLLSTLGCFGLGVLGLSYGVLSASWEVDVPGSRMGWSEFSVNFRRMVGAWRTPKS